MICYSGGAKGADTLWGQLAIADGQKVIHFHFDQRHSKKDNFYILREDSLLRADSRLIRANKTLNRTFPTSSHYVNSLLRRNVFQVASSDRVYAIANIVKGQVSGGTAWAVQTFLDRHQGLSCECYVFCQIKNVWFIWDNTINDGRGGFVESDRRPPKPHGYWTGIGSRELTEKGEAAAKELFNV
jgi:hypothetical protein